MAKVGAVILKERLIHDLVLTMLRNHRFDILHGDDVNAIKIECLAKLGLTDCFECFDAQEMHETNMECPVMKHISNMQIDVFARKNGVLFAIEVKSNLVNKNADRALGQCMRYFYEFKTGEPFRSPFNSKDFFLREGISLKRLSEIERIILVAESFRPEFKTLIIKMRLPITIFTLKEFGKWCEQ